MARRGSCWHQLGIEKTADSREIRRAYAAKLKTIDVDADPEAFIALRAALEQAQWEAKAEAWADEEAAPSDRADDAAPVDDPHDDALAGADPDPLAEAPPREPQSPWAPRHDFETHGEALDLLVRTIAEGGQPWQASQKMQAHLAAMLADPRMQDLTFYDDAERWLAGLIAYWIPISDPLVRPAGAHFGWFEDAGTVHESGNVVAINQRARDLAFRDELESGKHVLSGAWRELTTPAGEGSRRGRASRKRVDQLLETVRTSCPALENEFDSYRVALWEQSEAFRMPLGGWIAVIWVAVMLIRLFGSIGGPSYDTSSPQVTISAPYQIDSEAPLSNRDTDIASALRRVGDGSLSWTAVQRSNPNLAALLIARWRDAARDGQRKGDFESSTIAMLLDRYWQAIPATSDTTVVQTQRLRRDTLEALLARKPKDCADYIDGMQVSDFPSDLVQRRLQLIATTLIQVNELPPEPAKRFSIPPNIAERAIDKSGLTAKQMKTALGGTGDTTARCKAQIAIIDAALELERQGGIELMRKM